MNPRLFCRERSYDKALLLTYSFDPIFFEQMVLPDLWAGRSSDVLVIGDRDQIDAAMQTSARQLWHLGRHYQLAAARHAGAFHPKVLLRLGPKEGIVMVSSGNLTSSGWGGNQELGTAWMVGPNHADNGAWLHAFLDDVMSWCGGDLPLDALRRMKDMPWLALTPAVLGGPSPVIYSRQGRAVGPALAERWAGRRFDEVKILTGSTDESGAFLRWANTTFGVQRATVVLTPATASFIPQRLADLPLDLRLVAAPADRPLHAKLYWFDGPEGSAAVVGSANCSAAAWLLRPEQRGNVETVVVFDAPNADDFQGALALFEAPSQLPADLLGQQHPKAADTSKPAREYSLESLSWDAVSHRVSARIWPTPAADCSVHLIFAGQEVAMTLPPADETWVCELSDGIGVTTAFASIRLRQGDRVWDTLPHWIDDPVALERASQAAQVFAPFVGMERGGSSAEQNQILNELQDLARALFNDATFARDPGSGARRADTAEEETPPPPVNPNDLVCRLEESQEVLQQLSSLRDGALSLSGILRLLFDTHADHGDPAEAADDERLDEGQYPGGSEPPTAKRKGAQAVDEEERTPIAERSRQKLAAQIATFLEELSSSSFANRCTATQMVQAVCFPLAVALRGQRRGWVSAELAEQWALAVFAVLFYGGQPGRAGLLKGVEQRYIENEQRSTFNEVVSDGTLWTVLVATLGTARWQGASTEIDKALALREVFTAPQLTAAANPSLVASLVAKIRIENARTYLEQVAPTVTRLLGQIENVLRPIWEAGTRSQTARPIEHKLGDLFWRGNIGWGVCLADASAADPKPIRVRLRGVEKNVKVGFYVNVTDLCGRIPDLAALVAELQAAVAMGSEALR